jgi:hypothetical protein
MPYACVLSGRLRVYLPFRRRRKITQSETTRVVLSKFIVLDLTDDAKMTSPHVARHSLRTTIALATLTTLGGMCI